MNIQQQFKYIWYFWFGEWNIFRAASRSLERIAELEQLIKWARRKRHKGVHSYYKWEMQQEEQKLFRYTIRSRLMVSAATWWQTAKQQIKPTRYYSRRRAKRR